MLFLVYASMNRAVLRQSLICGLGQSFAKTSTIEPVLWLILMACLCHLVSAVTNTDGILKVDLRQTFVIKQVLWLILMTY